jgi:hypothetical protein
MACYDFDDWGYDHDCRMELEKLKEINPSFKVTLFTVPEKTTIEMLDWADENDYWVEIVQHGWDHHSNFECSQWSFEETALSLHKSAPYFKVKGFKAPGWQISDEALLALGEYDYWVADQPYNKDRRPLGIRVFETDPDKGDYHGHTWDCGCSNGINEDWDNIVGKVRMTDRFEFVSERVK